MFLVTEWFGAFLLEGGRVAAAREFPRDAREVARRLHALDRGEVLDEERALAEGREGVQVAETRLLQVPGTRLAAKAPTARDRAEERGFSQELFREAALELARQRTKAAMGGRDQHVVQAVQAIDDLSETANILAERMREWYGLHFPEADRLVERHEELATLISSHVTRDAILAASPHLRLKQDSMGADLGAEEQAMLRGFAKGLSTLYAQRAELERYLERAMPGIAPNVTTLVGAAIAARLLFHAGGLRDLAMMSSGTLQTLGAEKALFRHLKEGNRPPKHGVLFQHPLVHRAPYRQRGAIARALAGKVSIAARADAFTHHDIAAGLQRDLDQRVGEVRSAPRRPRPGGAPRGRPPARPPPGPPPRHAKPGTGAPRGPQGGKGFHRPPPGRPPPGRGERRDDRDRRGPRRHR